MLADPTGRRWYDMVQAGGEEGVKAALEIIDNFSRGTVPAGAAVPAGLRRLSLDLGPDHRRGGKIQRAGTLHRLHRLRMDLAGAARQQSASRRDLSRRRRQGEQTLPFTTYPPLGSTTPEDLWKHLQAYEDKTGGRVLAIAHNGNLSNGWMFPTETNPATGQPLSAEYAETRARWEPLYEVTQIKGDGEAHPYLSPTDEFAGYELWDKGNLNLSEAKKPEMLQSEYARTALQTGLQLEAKLGVNPYKFGMIGSTDSHTSLADRRGGQLLRQALRRRAQPASRRRTNSCATATCS